MSAADWTLVLSWFITANQGKSSTRESLLKIETLSVMNDDEEFKEWINTRLVASLGQKSIPQAQVVHQQMQMMAPTFSKDLGWELAHGLKKAAPCLTKYNDKTKKEVAKYSPDEWAHIMAFAGVNQAKHLPSLWTHFGKTKSKSLDIHRHVIETSMTKWGHSTRTEVDKIFLEAKTIEDIIALRFNPGDAVANFRTTKRGISILYC